MSTQHFVLLPGLEGTGQLFTPLLNLLEPDCKATVVTYPQSELLSYEQLMPYVLKALPAPEPFVLLAESFSGPLAVEIAAAARTNLQALVLCASFVSNPAPPGWQWIQRVNHPFWFQYRLPHWFVRYATAMWDCEASVITNLIEQTKSVRPEVLSFRLAQALSVDVRAALQRCHLPLLYLRAKRDVLVRRQNWEEIARLKPDATCTEIDASHFALQHKPAEALAAIQAFLAANFAR
jgi:pimeloyl-[acyl-carrier protein] methyl ester esterase